MTTNDRKESGRASELRRRFFLGANYRPGTNTLALAAPRTAIGQHAPPMSWPHDLRLCAEADVPGGPFASVGGER